MNCPIQFSGKNKKNIISLSSSEFTQRAKKVREENLKVCTIFSVSQCPLVSGVGSYGSI